MGVYKEFIEVTGIDGCKIYIKVASIIGLEDDDPVKLRFGDGDTYYRLKDSYEDVKRKLENCLIEETDDINFGLVEERKIGHWIIDGCIEMCDQCGEPRDFPHWKYCPNCGAKMGEEVNE